MPATAEIELAQTIDPPPQAIIPGRAVRVIRNIDLTLTANDNLPVGDALRAEAPAVCDAKLAQHFSKSDVFGRKGRRYRFLPE